MQNDILLIVDLQNVYLPQEPWACPSINNAIHNIKLLLNRGIPAVFTRFVPPVSSGTWKDYNEKYADINADVYLNEIVSDVKSYTIKHPIFDKSTYSSWTEEVQKATQEYDRILLSGVVAECCILSTLLSIIDSGKEVIYLTDCISGKSRQSEDTIRKLAESFSPIHVKIMDTKTYLDKI